MALTNPSQIAEAAEDIYEAEYRKEYEQSHNGEFVVIDVTNRHAYLGTHAEDALRTARRESPHGLFHLMRVGALGAFRVSYVDRQQSTEPTTWNWPLRPAR